MSRLSSIRLVGRISITYPQLERQEATIDAYRVRMPPLPYKIVVALMLTHPDKFVPMTRLIEILYPDADAQPIQATNCISTYIRDLRRFGVPIENRPTFGWRIPLANRLQGRTRKLEPCTNVLDILTYRSVRRKN